MKTTHPSRHALVLCAWIAAAPAAAQWAGLTDRSADLRASTFSFGGSNPEAIGNQNYYDGDFADFDGDGLPDRTLGARYGLLLNTGDGLMRPFAGATSFLFRGMAGASGWGEDGFQWADVDNDGDYDNLSGGNGEPLTLQINQGGRFSVRWQQSISALNIVNTDLERDGDVDLLVAHAFCSGGPCGGPVAFNVLVNNGTGTMAQQTTARGITFNTGTDYVVGVVSGDVDGDRDYDFLVIHGAASELKLARNSGTGNFTLESVPFARPKAEITWIQSGFGQAMNLGDIDDDGDLDLVTGLGGHVGLHPYVTAVVMINDGTGRFTDESASRFDTGSYSGEAFSSENAKLVDIDYDGDLDFLSLERNTGTGVVQGKRFTLFLNDGSGRFSYDAAHSMAWVEATVDLGGDLDIADLDGDGDYDVWLGLAAEPVKILINNHSDPSGLRADQVRNLRVVSSGVTGVTLAWKAPPFASQSRYYKVYRSTSPGWFDRDRKLIKIVGQRHQDDMFVDGITRHTTTAALGDSDVALDGAIESIQFVDRTAVPGVTYYYSVSHVGAENSEGRPSPEVRAMIPGTGGADTTAPAIQILSPGGQDWYPHPRVVVQYADGQSGVDPASVRVRFDRDLGNPTAGGRAAGTDVSDLAYQRDSRGLIAALAPPLALPLSTLVTMTVEVADLAGNRGTATSQFFVQGAATTAPTASFTVSPNSGSAPLSVQVDASASADSDGKLYKWEWYFGDGTTGFGRKASHTFAAGGTYIVRLIARDNAGGIASATQMVNVSGGAAICEVGLVQACYSGPAQTAGVGTCGGGNQTCGAGGWGTCQGEVVPAAEVCGDGVDGDCDGVADETDSDCPPPARCSCGAGAGLSVAWAALMALAPRRRRQARRRNGQ